MSASSLSFDRTGRYRYQVAPSPSLSTSQSICRHQSPLDTRCHCFLASFTPPSDESRAERSASMALSLPEDPYLQTNEDDDIVGLTYRPIDELQEVERVKDGTAGAVCTFIGTTRDNFEGKGRAGPAQPLWGGIARSVNWLISSFALSLCLHTCPTNEQPIEPPPDTQAKPCLSWSTKHTLRWHSRR